MANGLFKRCAPMLTITAIKGSTSSFDSSITKAARCNLWCRLLPAFPIWFGFWCTLILLCCFVLLSLGCRGGGHGFLEASMTGGQQGSKQSLSKIMGSMQNYLVTVSKLLSHSPNIGITSVTQLTQVALPIHVCGPPICIHSRVSALQYSMSSAQTSKPKFGALQSTAKALYIGICWW